MNIRRDLLVSFQHLNDQCRYTTSKNQIMMEETGEYRVNNEVQCNHEPKTLSLQDEVTSLKSIIKSRDEEINKLKREVHKLKVNFKFISHFANASFPKKDINVEAFLVRPECQPNSILIIFV